MTGKILPDRVPEERWQQAQAWEEAHWVDAQRMRARYFKNYIWRLLALFRLVPKYRGDDWNWWWSEKFDHYNFLPRNVENALEVGCGPYSNMRVIMEKCYPKHLFLSDPLIRTYVNFKLTFVADMYRKGLCTLDDHPLEELPFASDYFDLVVMINVLDHVRSARQCMENLLRVTRPGGIFIIGQELTSSEDLTVLKQDAGEVGHPIKLDHAWFNPYLARAEPIINKILKREEGRVPDCHYATLLFAGRKR